VLTTQVADIASPDRRATFELAKLVRAAIYIVASESPAKNWRICLARSEPRERAESTRGLVGG